MKKLFHSIYHIFTYKLTLMKKLMISYVLLIIFPLTLYTFVSYNQVSSTLVEQFQYSSNNTLQQTTLYLDKILTDVINTTDQAAFHDTLTDFFYRDSSNDSLPSLITKYEEIKNTLDSLFVSSELYSIELYLNKEDVLCLSESNGQRNIHFISMDNTFATNLNEQLSDHIGRILWLPPRNVQHNITKEESRIVTGAKYIKNILYNTNVGIITINIDQEYLNSIIKSSTVLPNSFSLLLDAKGNVMAVSDPDIFQNSSISSKLIFDSIENDKDSITMDEQMMLLDSSAIKATDWTLVTVIPYEEMLKTGINTRNLMLLVMLAVSFLFLGIAYFISILITRRIQKLTDTMQNIRMEEYPVIEEEEDGNDEISILAHTYNYMMEKIKDYSDTHYQMGIDLKNSEMKALQAQINPHFLYNTLDLVHWISVQYGAEEISEIVSLLSKFYKLSLNHGKEIISVRDAINHLKIYVQLQNHRFDDAIQLNLELNPEIYDYGILNLLLQPIVENSILHGIFEKEIPNGTITVIGEVEDKILTFKIIDDGIGMTREQIDHILRSSETDTSSRSSSNGYGIKNIIDRIHLYYGTEYDLTYESVPGEYTMALLRIPGLDIPE